MRIITLMVIVFLISTATFSAAFAEDFPFITTALSKRYIDKNVYPNKETEVAVKILTNTSIDANKRKESILYALNFHEKLCQAFLKKGWQTCHPLDVQNDMGALELTFEPRMNLKLKATIVMKTFLYVCEDDKLWNMVKYRGGSVVKYFDKIVNKTENCTMRSKR